MNRLSKHKKATKDQTQRWVMAAADKFQRKPNETFLDKVAGELTGFAENTAWTVMNEVAKKCKSFPSLMELTRMCRDIEPRTLKETSLGQKWCGDCDNTGGVLMADPDKGYQALAACSCSKGKMLRLDRKYRSKEDLSKMGYTLTWKQYQKRRFDERHND